MSGTQGVNATSFSAATNVLVPEHQVWTAPYFRMKGFALQSQLPFGNWKIGNLWTAYTILIPGHNYFWRPIKDLFVLFLLLSWNCCSERAWEVNFACKRVVWRNLKLLFRWVHSSQRNFRWSCDSCSSQKLGCVASTAGVQSRSVPSRKQPRKTSIRVYSLFSRAKKLHWWVCVHTLNYMGVAS